MSRELFTSWGQYQTAIDTVLAAAGRTLCIFDPDLEVLKLDSSSRHEQLQRLLLTAEPGAIRIAVRNPEYLKKHTPRLLHLLEMHGHVMTIVETSGSIAHLRDAMILVDGRHGLIRFDQEQARSKLVLNDETELMPYQKRFNDIWLEGNSPISANTTGL